MCERFCMARQGDQIQAPACVDDINPIVIMISIIMMSITMMSIIMMPTN